MFSMTWEPISEARLLADIEVAEFAMEPQSLAVWKMISVCPVKWSLSPWGDNGGGFWVVAVVGQECVWYNDIEDGFDISPFSQFGVIGDYRCSQLELHHCVYRYIEMFRKAVGGVAIRPGV
jgi:hypothetical protein